MKTTKSLIARITPAALASLIENKTICTVEFATKEYPDGVIIKGSFTETVAQDLYAFQLLDASNWPESFAGLEIYEDQILTMWEGV